jgi:hypothetical protein
MFGPAHATDAILPSTTHPVTSHPTNVQQKPTPSMYHQRRPPLSGGRGPIGAATHQLLGTSATARTASLEGAPAALRQPVHAVCGPPSAWAATDTPGRSLACLAAAFLVIGALTLLMPRATPRAVQGMMLARARRRRRPRRVRGAACPVRSTTELARRTGASLDRATNTIIASVIRVVTCMRQSAHALAVRLLERMHNSCPALANVAYRTVRACSLLVPPLVPYTLAVLRTCRAVGSPIASWICKLLACMQHLRHAAARHAWTTHLRPSRATLHATSAIVLCLAGGRAIAPAFAAAPPCNVLVHALRTVLTTACAAVRTCGRSHAAAHLLLPIAAWLVQTTAALVSQLQCMPWPAHPHEHPAHNQGTSSRSQLALCWRLLTYFANTLATDMALLRAAAQASLRAGRCAARTWVRRAAHGPPDTAPAGRRLLLATPALAIWLLARIIEQCAPCAAVPVHIVRQHLKAVVRLSRAAPRQCHMAAGRAATLVARHAPAAAQCTAVCTLGIQLLTRSTASHDGTPDIIAQWAALQAALTLHSLQPATAAGCMRWTRIRTAWACGLARLRRRPTMPDWDPAAAPRQVAPAMKATLNPRPWITPARAQAAATLITSCALAALPFLPDACTEIIFRTARAAWMALLPTHPQDTHMLLPW